MRRLEVRLQGRADQPGLPIGALAEQKGRIYFEYDADFLKRPLWLSPFKLPPTPGVVEFTDRAFGPIFGLFDDSLPDGWGLLLMDRHFQSQGLLPGEISVLDRLAYLGSRTMGALTYHPPAESGVAQERLLELHTLARAAKELIQGRAHEVLPQLLRAGGSPGGARPKVLVGVSEDRLISGEGALPEGYEGWMVKFPSGHDLPDSALVEHAYNLMAAEAGLDLPATRLFDAAGGARYFGVKRFDRDRGRRIHAHTFGNLIHANFRVPSCDYAQLLRVCKILTKDEHQVAECYRRMIFNVLAHNRDDHVKNTSFLLNEDTGEWRLAPAYDLTFSPGPGGEHSMTLAGEGRHPRLAHALTLADQMELPREAAMALISEVAAAVSRWSAIARRVGVRRPSMTQIQAALKGCTLD